MARYPSDTLGRLWRYYQVGLINTLFGYGMFVLLVTAEFNMFVAQMVAHVLGATFNYFSYSKHVFKNSSASKLRFLISYTFNYLIGLVSLAVAAVVIPSPYIAGGAAILFASVVNFLVLKNLVFTKPAC